MLGGYLYQIVSHKIFLVYLDVALRRIQSPLSSIAEDL